MNNELVTVEQAQAYADTYDLGNGVKLIARLIETPSANALIYLLPEVSMKGGVQVYRVIRENGDVVTVSRFGSGIGAATLSRVIEKFHADEDVRELLRMTHLTVGNVKQDSYRGGEEPEHDGHERT